MAKTTWRDTVLHALPRPLARWAYGRRNHPLAVRAEALPGVMIDVTIPSRSRLWQSRLAQTGGHEPEICAWLQQHLRPDEVFVDVGAAFGFFPALVQTLRPRADIHALEADWRNVDLLAATARRYGSRWHLREGFLGNHDGPESLRLDTYAAGLPGLPTLVKMDVDGAEAAILQGAKNLIAARQTEFLVELHPLVLPHFGSSAAEVLALFADRYRIRVLPNLRPGETPGPGGGWTDDLTWLERDPNPYVYLAPEEIARF